MASEAEHPFICLLAFCMSSLEKCLLKSFACSLIFSHKFLQLIFILNQLSRSVALKIFDHYEYGS